MNNTICSKYIIFDYERKELLFNPSILTDLLVIPVVYSKEIETIMDWIKTNLNPIRLKNTCFYRSIDYVNEYFNQVHNAPKNIKDPLLIFADYLANLWKLFCTPLDTKVKKIEP